MTQDYLTSQEVAEMLGVTVMTVGRYIKKGLLPGTKRTDPTAKKSPYRIPREAAEKFRAAQIISPEPETEQL
jgi:predicted site-specific integrase-resolvase